MSRSAGPGGPRFPLALSRVGAAVAVVVPPGGAAVLRPQRPLHEAAEAAREALRRSPPGGLGMDSEAVRRRMVSRLQAGGLRAQAVAEAMRAVPRHAFVDPGLATQAYEDTSLPIGHGQTISKPSVVARMLDLLLDGNHARASGSLGRVLEVGTGCGYQTALLARLATQVVSVERLQPLHDKARQHLGAAGLLAVRLLHGDGMLGHAAGAPYDSIIAAAGGAELPQAWLDQLAIGGRLVAPLRRGRGQVLCVVDRLAQGYTHSEHEAVHFVPLKSGVS